MSLFHIIHSHKRIAAVVGACLLTGSIVTGCSAIGFYVQTAKGHLEIVRQKEPIDAIISDRDVDEVTRARLERTQIMRTFASSELGLPDNDSYTEYADIGRPYVVWSVTAAPEFSLKPYKSCYLFVGCMSYRGYHSKRSANAFARDLQDDGFEVSVRGVAAYSTLGWFDDPLLNTMMHWSDTQLARLIFHELSHQVVYIKNDTAFNEAFAVSVEKEGIKRWLAQFATDEEVQNAKQQATRHNQFIDHVLNFRDTLAALYSSDLEEREMRQAKLKAYDKFHRDYLVMKAGWNNFAGYDNWFSDVNNAKIALFSTYREKVDGFTKILASTGFDLSSFYEKVDKISKLDREDRDLCLVDLAQCKVL